MIVYDLRSSWATKEAIEEADLSAFLPAPGTGSPLDQARERLATLRELESEYINWVIERCGGNKTRAAEVLGIDPSTIHRRARTPSTETLPTGRPERSE